MNILRQIRFSVRKYLNIAKIYCHYNPIPTCKRADNTFVQIIDGSIYHGGIADRINSIITAYGVAKAVGSDYKLLHTSPFRMEDYLIPNKHNWIADNVSFNLWQTKVFWFRRLAFKKPIRYNHSKQYHAYFHTNALESLNKIYNTQYTHSELFNELFTATPHLQNEIDRHTNQLPKDYESVVFRFQNLLGDYHEGGCKAYSNEKQEELIALCLNYLSSRNNRKLLITSDSTTFLKRASKLENIYIIDGERVHMQYNKGSFESNEKPFLDMFMLSKSSKITLIVARDMYKSGFPMLASLIGKNTFEIISVR